MTKFQTNSKLYRLNTYVFIVYALHFFYTRFLSVSLSIDVCIKIVAHPRRSLLKPIPNAFGNAMDLILLLYSEFLFFLLHAHRTHSK